nr:DNA ligase 1-like [Ipomoea batatas]GME18123.1 DNA ligase 1-like [Ipomoea batatas]
MIEYVSSWFTPTVLFCVLNLVIGTILLSSSLKPQKKQHQLGDDNSVPQLARVPSLIQRVRSFNYSFRQEHDPFSYAQNTPSLSRAPSLLERFSAVNFSFSRSDHPGDFPANTHYADPPENETQITRTPSLLERVKSINLSFSRSRQPDPFPSNSSFSHSDYPGDFPANTHHADPPENETQTTRAPSLLERVKSINLSFSRSRQPDPFPSTTHFTELQTQKVEVEEEERDSGTVMSHARRTKSATCAEIPAKKAKKKMEKSTKCCTIILSIKERNKIVDNVKIDILLGFHRMIRQPVSSVIGCNGFESGLGHGNHLVAPPWSSQATMEQHYDG